LRPYFTEDDGHAMTMSFDSYTYNNGPIQTVPSGIFTSINGF